MGCNGCIAIVDKSPNFGVVYAEQLAPPRTQNFAQ